MITQSWKRVKYDSSDRCCALYSHIVHQTRGVIERRLSVGIHDTGTVGSSPTRLTINTVRKEDNGKATDKIQLPKNKLSKLFLLSAKLGVENGKQFTYTLLKPVGGEISELVVSGLYSAQFEHFSLKKGTRETELTSLNNCEKLPFGFESANGGSNSVVCLPFLLDAPVKNSNWQIKNAVKQV